MELQKITGATRVSDYPTIQSANMELIETNVNALNTAKENNGISIVDGMMCITYNND